jgi:hypothetical protein
MGNICAPTCEKHKRKKTLTAIPCRKCPHFCIPNYEYRCLECDYDSGDIWNLLFLSIYPDKK